MFTDTIQHPSTNSFTPPPSLDLLFPAAPGAVSKPAFAQPQFTTVSNPDTSFTLYTRYRDAAVSLINTVDPEIFYRIYYNEQTSYNGEGVHEKYIYRGQPVLDVSVGLLDFPWFAADGSPLNEITALQLQVLANVETNITIASRLRYISNFAATLPPHTRFYHYHGLDGTRALTICDEFHGIKMNCILTHNCETLLSGSM